MNFIYEFHLYPLKMHMNTKNELFSSRHSKVIVLQTYRHITPNNVYDTASRVIKIKKFCKHDMDVCTRSMQSAQQLTLSTFGVIMNF